MDFNKTEDRLKFLINSKYGFPEIEESPNENSTEISREIINSISGKFLKTPAINPTHEGGILLEWAWSDSDEYISIEVTNGGDIVILHRNKDGLSASDFNKIKDLIQYVEKMQSQNKNNSYRKLKGDPFACGKFRKKDKQKHKAVIKEETRKISEQGMFDD